MLTNYRKFQQFAIKILCNSIQLATKHQSNPCFIVAAPFLQLPFNILCTQNRLSCIFNYSQVVNLGSQLLDYVANAQTLNAITHLNACMQLLHLQVNGQLVIAIYSHLQQSIAILNQLASYLASRTKYQLFNEFQIFWLELITEAIFFY